MNIDEVDELEIEEFYIKPCCDLKSNKKIPREETVKERFVIIFYLHMVLLIKIMVFINISSNLKMHFI